MTNKQTIGTRAAKLFGGKTFTVKMLYAKEIGKFLRAMEAAHKRTSDGTLVFKA